MDQEVAKTLGELERKLNALERELAAADSGGGGVRVVDEAGADPPAPPAPEPGPAIDLAELRGFRERIERFAKELIDDYEQLVGRVEASLEGAAAPGLAQQREATFEGRVELGVGPFYDVGSLGAFEQSLTRLPNAADVTVRRFEASHAVIDLRLTAPIALVRELRAVLDSDFSVREAGDNRLFLTFDES